MVEFETFAKAIVFSLFLAGILYAIYWIYQQSQLTNEWAKQAGQDITNYANKAAQDITNYANKAGGDINQAFDAAGKSINNTLEIVGQDLDKAFTPVIPGKKPCPDGMRDDGTSCWLESYGNGVGYPWKFGDPLNLDNAKKRCEADSKTGGCKKQGEIYYPFCKDGFKGNGLFCEPESGIGIKLTAFDRYVCPPPGFPEHTKLEGALCKKP